MLIIYILFFYDLCSDLLFVSKRKVKPWGILVMINESLGCFAYHYQDKLRRLQNTAQQNEYRMLYIVLPAAMRFCYSPNTSPSVAGDTV